VVDVSGVSFVGNILESEREILTYISERESVEHITRLQSDLELRINIPTNAYKKEIANYSYPSRLIDLFDWFKEMRKL
jgi:hypothetical protein